MACLGSVALTPEPDPDPEPLIAALRAVGCVFAEEEAAEIRRVLGADDEAADAVVASRAAGVPLEHALGVALFAGIEVRVGAGVFVPRARAEVLVDEAARLRPDAHVVVDLGTGSGAIAAALSARLPHADVHATELDPQAVAAARRNAERYGFAVHEGDWWDALPTELNKTVDLAVAYLPHVPTSRLDEIPGDYRTHEPDPAVAGGPDGLDPLRQVVDGLDVWLAPGGILITLVAEEQLQAAQRIVAGRPVELVVG